MSPRPILKSLPTAPPKPARPSWTGHVHFPPTPNLSATFLTHGRSYDRSAIVVSPNECALPERNCPERTYVLSEGKGEARLLKSVVGPEQVLMNEDVEHTPAPELDQRTDYFSALPPSLTPDMTSSESDDSDGLMSPPNEIDPDDDNAPIPILSLAVFDDIHTYTQGIHPTSPFDTSSTPDALTLPRTNPSPEHVKAALAFLPHPLPPVRERKRSLSPLDRERKRDRARSFSGSDISGFATPVRRRRASSFAPEVSSDSGCLGGF